MSLARNGKPRRGGKSSDPITPIFIRMIWLMSNMISLDGKKLANHWLRLLAVTMLFPFGCVKSQQNPDSSHSTTVNGPDSAESFLWIDEVSSDTTRLRFGEFELVEIEGQAEDQLIGHFEGKTVTVISG